MDTQTFNKFRDLVYEKSGISLGQNKQALVCARVGKRMRSLGFENFRKYYMHVAADKSGRELVELLDVISTNVTHFFRENQHFDFLSSLIKEWKGQGQRRFRIWCAASSSGEEPYSIAITLREVLDSSMDAKILATDISTKVLEQAMQGTYREKHLETVPKDLWLKYFTKMPGLENGSYQVQKTLRDMITFGRLNLSVQPYPLHGPLDVIFCRNVMIYFDNEIRRGVLENMYSLLRPGGYLMVGHAESLTGLVSNFKNVMPSVYVKG
jgi:chemotaxis protein methyltransferase CheR